MGTSAKSLRINALLEPPLYAAVEALAKRRGQSLSLLVRDLVRDAIELVEDRGLTDFAEERRKTFDRQKALSVPQVRARLKAARKRT